MRVDTQHMAKAQMDSLITHALESAQLTRCQAYALARRMEGLKHREIAEEMGVSRVVITKMIRIALSKMRRNTPRFGSHRATASD